MSCAVTNAATSVGLTAATLNGDTSACTPGLSSGFEWGKTTGYGHTVWVLIDDQGEYSKRITGLDSGTVYHYRAIYNGNTGSDVSFETDTCVETNAATNVTEGSAKLNGDASNCGVLDSGFQYRKTGASSWTNVFVGWDIGSVFDKYISGLDDDQEYQFRATYDNYSQYGSTLTFTTDAAPTEYDEDVAGALSPAGTVSVKHTHTPSEYYKEPSGGVTPAGALEAFFIAGATLNEEDVAGGVTPTGACAALKIPAPNEEDVAGEVTPTGACEAELIEAAAFNEAPAAGAIAPSGEVSVKHITPYIADANPGLAAKLDMVVEQGATFPKTFSWKDENGIIIDLSPYALYMTIRPYKGSSIIIANSLLGDIEITKLEDVGYFEIRISSDVTANFDFTRAVYDIEAHRGRIVYRLVEGDLLLSKEATADA